MKTTALLLASAATLAAAAGHHDETIHVQYDRSECYGLKNDPAPGPKDKHGNNVCFQQQWCPNQVATDFCILRDMKGKHVGIVQLEDTISYYLENKDKRAEMHVTSHGTYFFEKEDSAVSFTYSFISNSYVDLYNQGHISVNTLAGSGKTFNMIADRGEIDIKVKGNHRTIEIHVPKKHKGDHNKGHADSYGDHNKGLVDSSYKGHADSYSDHNINSYGDQHNTGYDDQHNTGYGDHNAVQPQRSSLTASQVTGTWAISPGVFGVNEWGAMTAKPGKGFYAFEALENGVARIIYINSDVLGTDPMGNPIFTHAEESAADFIGFIDFQTRALKAVQPNEFGTLEINFSSPTEATGWMTRPGGLHKHSTTVIRFDLNKVSDEYSQGALWSFRPEPEVEV